MPNTIEGCRNRIHLFVRYINAVFLITLFSKKSKTGS